MIWGTKAYEKGERISLPFLPDKEIRSGGTKMKALLTPLSYQVLVRSTSHYYFFVRETSCVSRSFKSSECVRCLPNTIPEAIDGEYWNLLLDLCTTYGASGTCFWACISQFLSMLLQSRAKLANSKRLFHHSPVPLCLSEINYHSRPIFGTSFSEYSVSLRRFHRIGRRKSVVLTISSEKGNQSP